MKISEIISRLEKRFPISNKENWDNVGLLVGRRENEVEKIQISLDVTLKVIDEAVKNNIDLIISHHPLIFSSIKEINDNSVLGEKLLKLIENGIAVYSMHTNLDSTISGLNDLVGKKLGFSEGKILDKVKVNLYKLEFYTLKKAEIAEFLSKEDLKFESISFGDKEKVMIVGKFEKLQNIISKLKSKSLVGDHYLSMLENKYVENGIGRVYSLPKRERLVNFIESLKEKLEIDSVIASGYDLENQEVKKIAIVNGSGSSYWKKAKRVGADVLLTGDLKYHEALDAKEEGVTILDIGHYESEHFFNILIKDSLKDIKNIDILIYNDEPVLRKL